MIKELENLTILVNSCDAYSDLWDPFFKLFKKYGGELTNCQIILNADSKQYSYPGLNIICPNNFSTPQPWGKRVKNCLKNIKTKYVLCILDDYFLQRECDTSVIIDCINWLNNNENIGAFNLLSLKNSEDESPTYHKFCYINNNSEYRLNSQVCVWRKDIFDFSLISEESPWDWETFGNKRNAVLLSNVDFYCISEKYPEPYFYNSEFCNKKYSPDVVRNAVIRGKWDLNCIEKCFKENNINIDYNKRGIYIPEKNIGLLKKLTKKLKKLIHLKNTLNNRKKAKIEQKEKYYNFVKKYIEKKED